MHFRIVFPRIFLAFAVAALVVTAETRAQTELPKLPESRETLFSPMVQPDLFEFAGGYSYIYKADDLVKSLNGFSASGFINVTPWLALGGEFLGGFSSGSHQRAYYYRIDSERYWYYVFGPRLSLWPTNNIRVFSQLLLGGAHDTIKSTRFFVFEQTVSESSVAALLGGGVDWRFARHFSWRVVEGNYLPTDFNHSHQNNWQVSTGIVYSFGGR
jgi:hypothetical protein